MNDVREQEYVRDIVRKKFRGRRTLKSKVITHYKENIEREYERVIARYFEVLDDTLCSIMENVLNAPTGAYGGQRVFRADDEKSDLLEYIRRLFREGKMKMQGSETAYDLERKIKRMADSTEKLSIADWKRMVKKTLGVDIFDDYYSGEFFRSEIDRWIAENVELIKTLPEGALDNMQTIVENGFREGKLGRDIVKEIQEAYKVSKNQAKFYAVDQMAKLNAAITQKQQRDAGVEAYEWRTAGDQRVRERHKELDHTIHRWDEPPVVDQKTGRKAHPGEDYRCRCVAIPVFDLDTLNLPIKMDVKKGEEGG